MVVDDTIFYRKIVSDILTELDSVEVVGTANNGKIALTKIRTLKPDLLTLDVEMPIMNGLELMKEINREGLDVGSIMLSSKTQKGSEATMRALELGAFDFISKPDSDSTRDNVEAIKSELAKLLKGFVRYRRFRRKPGERPAAVSRKPAVVTRPAQPLKRTEKSQAIAIGVSTGGPNSLAQMLPQIPGDIGIPIFLVQHMPPIFTASLAQSLDRKCTLKVKEAEEGEEVEVNTVYIAPGGKQMGVGSKAGLKKVIRITDAPPENNCKPSVDYLFRSVAREYGSKATCVIMTGMGFDGKLGLSIAKAAGSIGIAQDQTSCVVYGMPKAVVDAGLADIVTPLDLLAQEISKTVQ